MSDWKRKFEKAGFSPGHRKFKVEEEGRLVRILIEDEWEKDGWDKFEFTSWKDAYTFMYGFNIGYATGYSDGY